MLQSPRISGLTGRRFRYSMCAQGRGEFLLGCIEYRSTEKFKPHYKYRWQEEPVQLGDQWQEVVFEFAVSDPEVRSLAVVAEVRGVDAEAFLDDAVLRQWQQPGVVITADPAHAMLAIGESLDICIRLTKDGLPVKDGPLTVLALPATGEPLSSELASVATDGPAVYTLKTSSKMAQGIHRLVITHPRSGAVTECFVDLTDRQTWDTFAAAARGATVEPTPAHFLFIGDSLTDQQRGYNYVDKLAFWLRHPGQKTLTWRNAGVGGDYISRVWQRIEW